MSDSDGTIGRIAVPLSPQDISRIFRRTHGGSLNTSDWDFADQLQRECLLRMGVSTLRDEFAAKAMQGLLAQSMGTALGSPVEEAAAYAYAMADAMLAERTKATGEGA